jgi:fluoride exporter
LISTKLLISVAAGGAIGAVGRYVVSTYVSQVTAGEFPYGTLTVNIVGSLVMGALVALLGVVWSPGPEVRAFLTTGVLGAFTTFSLFSLDLAAMIERGDMMSAGAYASASVLLCVGGFFVGNQLIRTLV